MMICAIHTDALCHRRKEGRHFVGCWKWSRTSVQLCGSFRRHISVHNIRHNCVVLFHAVEWQKWQSKTTIGITWTSSIETGWQFLFDSFTPDFPCGRLSFFWREFSRPFILFGWQLFFKIYCIWPNPLFCMETMVELCNNSLYLSSLNSPFDKPDKNLTRTLSRPPTLLFALKEELFARCFNIHH